MIRRRRRNDLIERFVVAHHAEVTAGTLFDCVQPFLQVLHFRSKLLVAFLELDVLLCLRSHRVLQPMHFANSAIG